MFAQAREKTRGAHSAIIHYPTLRNGGVWPVVPLAALNKPADLVLVTEVGVDANNNGSIECPTSGAQFDKDGAPAGNSFPYPYLPRYRHTGTANSELGFPVQGVWAVGGVTTGGQVEARARNRPYRSNDLIPP